MGENIKKILTNELTGHATTLKDYKWDIVKTSQFLSVFEPKLRSMDELLRDNPEYREIGAVGVAHALIPHEKPETCVFYDWTKLLCFPCSILRY